MTGTENTVISSVLIFALVVELVYTPFLKIGSHMRDCGFKSRQGHKDAGRANKNMSPLLPRSASFVQRYPHLVAFIGHTKNTKHKKWTP